MLIGPRDRWWSGPRGLGFGPAGGDHSAVGVGEDDPASEVGVPGDAQLALVVQAVVVRTEADQIPGVRPAAVFPVDDVVHLEVLVAATSGNPAASVTEDHDTPGAVRD